MRPLLLIFLILRFTTFGFSQATDSSAFASGELAGEIKAAAQVDSKEVPQNRTLTFTIKVSWKGALDRFEIENIETPLLTNLEIDSSASSNWVGEIGGVKQASKTYEFYLKPIELGMAYIDGSIIEYNDTEADKIHRLVTNRLEIKVIDPIKETVFPWTIIVSTLSGIALLAFSAMFLQKKKRRKEAALRQKAIDMTPMEDSFLSEMKEKVDLEKNDVVDSFSSLSKLLRKYLSEKYHIPSLEITSKEIGAELNKLAVPEKIIQQTEEILNSCDVAKFSGGEVERGSLERVYTLVEDILNQNRNEFLNQVNQSET